MNCIRLGVDPIGIPMWKWRRNAESDKEKDYGYVCHALHNVTDGSWRDRHVLVSSKNIRT